MIIKSLYKDYFQKSRVFLYPVLGIKRGVSVTPIQTYISWNDHYKETDAKLICLYHLRNDKDFKLFESSHLIGNKLFHDFKDVGNGKAVYIFDLSAYKQDWKCFIEGKYSMMTPDHKRKIKTYYGQNSPNFAYIESFLHPEKYFSMYAHIMGVDEGILKKVGELCSKPDIEQETLNIKIESLDIKEKTS